MRTEDDGVREGEGGRRVEWSAVRLAFLNQRLAGLLQVNEVWFLLARHHSMEESDSEI